MPISIFGGVNLLAEFNLMENPELEKSIAQITVENIDYVPSAVVVSSSHPLSERKFRATAFAARVHSLKYYIGLIGAPSII